MKYSHLTGHFGTLTSFRNTDLSALVNDFIFENDNI